MSFFKLSDFSESKAQVDLTGCQKQVIARKNRSAYCVCLLKGFQRGRGMANVKIDQASKVHCTRIRKRIFVHEFL